MLNRAAFYDHFTDKFDLAGKMIEHQFRARARARELWIPEEESCRERTRQLILMTCVFLSEYFTATQKISGQFYSLMESRIREGD